MPCMTKFYKSSLAFELTPLRENNKTKTVKDLPIGTHEGKVHFVSVLTWMDIKCLKKIESKQKSLT